MSPSPTAIRSALSRSSSRGFVRSTTTLSLLQCSYAKAATIPFAKVLALNEDEDGYEAGSEGGESEDGGRCVYEELPRGQPVV